MNHALCNSCSNLVPARAVQRNGGVFLVKDCPHCGQTETLVSSDAARYMSKRSLDGRHEYRGCRLDCLRCGQAHKGPSLVFVDVTNRCNLNCPICINNTPSMGFVFEPPLEYFETIFEHCATQDPRPAIQLFGGEPTVRDDLCEIIRMAKSRGLPTRVVTNGLKLAEEEYCRRLVATGATVLIAFDGCNPETYRVLRGTEKALELKRKAIENLCRVGRAKVILLTLVASGFNDQELPELFQFCHQRRGVIRGIYLIPLAHTWESADLGVEPQRITTEDIETITDRSFCDDRVEFLPAGLSAQLPTVVRCLGLKPLPFAGAHPNCESVCLLVSDGERYVPVTRYLKSSSTEVARALLAAEERLARWAEALEEGFSGRLLARMGLKDKALRLRGILAVAGILRRHGRGAELLRGGRLGKLWHALLVPIKVALGIRFEDVLARHTHIQGALQLIITPFGDRFNLETDRLERCPAVFAFVDPNTAKVEHVPACAWSLHKSRVMKEINEHYSQEAREGALATQAKR